MEKRLYRNREDKMLGGISSGLAEYFEMDVTWVRIIFVFATVFGGSGILIYLILWIVVPPKPFNPAGFSSYSADYRVYEERGFQPSSGGFGHFETPQPPYLKKKQRKGNIRFAVGVALVLLGVSFLMEEFDLLPYWFDFEKLWPVIFIVLGVLLISRAPKKSRDKQPGDNGEIQAEPGEKNADETNG